MHRCECVLVGACLRETNACPAPGNALVRGGNHAIPQYFAAFADTLISSLLLSVLHRFKRVGPNAMRGRGIGTARCVPPSSLAALLLVADLIYFHSPARFF